MTAKARRDLLEIGDYIARDNPERAASFVDELRAKCRSLADMAQAFPVVPHFAQYRIRRRPHRNYLIFYRIESDHILVLHVLHSARDYGALLSL